MEALFVLWERPPAALEKRHFDQSFDPCPAVTRVVLLLLVQGAEGVSSGVLKWSSSHTHTTEPSSSATLLAGQGKHSCCLDDIL